MIAKQPEVSIKISKLSCRTLYAQIGNLGFDLQHAPLVAYDCRVDTGDMLQNFDTNGHWHFHPAIQYVLTIGFYTRRNLIAVVAVQG